MAVCATASNAHGETERRMPFSNRCSYWSGWQLSSLSLVQISLGITRIGAGRQVEIARCSGNRSASDSGLGFGYW